MALQIGELFARLVADDSQFNRTLRGAESTFSSVGESMSKAGKKLTMSVTAPILAIGTAAFSASSDFEASMKKIQTVADTSVVPIDELSSGILNLSDELKVVSADELSAAMYEAISATGDTANALGFVEVAAKAAVGGFTDTKTAVDGLTTVLNAYGMKGTEAMKSVSDEMLVAQNFGKTTFGEMASSIGNVIPIAAALDVSTKELFASIATLTKNGIATSESVTGMKAALSNIIKPSKEAADTASALGLEFNAAHLKSVGWAQFLDEVKAKTGGNTETMAKLFGSVEALNSVTVLATTGAADFSAALGAMDAAAGATDKAFNTMGEGSKATMAEVTNSAKNLAIEFGDILAPILMSVFEEVKKGIDWFRGLDDEQKKNIVSIAAFAAAVGPVLMVLGSLFSAIGSIIGVINMIIPLFAVGTTGVSAFGAAIAFITGPIGWAIAAIVAIGAAVVWLYNKNEWFRNMVNAIWQSILTFFSVTVPESFNKFKEFMGNFFATVGELWKLFWSKSLTYWVGYALGWMYTKVVEMIPKMIDFFKTLPAKISEAFTNLMTMIQEILPKIVQKGADLGRQFVDAVMSFMSGLPGKVASMASNAIDGAKNAVNNFISGIKDSVSNAISGPTSAPSTSSGKKIPGLASGGIVTGPTMALIGEGAESEVVSPLSKLPGLMRGMGMGGSGVSVGQVVVNASGGNAQQIAKSIRQELSFELRKVARL